MWVFFKKKHKTLKLSSDTPCNLLFLTRTHLQQVSHGNRIRPHVPSAEADHRGRLPTPRRHRGCDRRRCKRLARSQEGRHRCRYGHRWLRRVQASEYFSSIVDASKYR